MCEQQVAADFMDLSLAFANDAGEMTGTALHSSSAHQLVASCVVTCRCVAEHFGAPSVKLSVRPTKCIPRGICSLPSRSRCLACRKSSGARARSSRCKYWVWQPEA